MARTANRFTKGSAVYECRCCGYRTRDTGRGDNEGVRLCADCYDLSGEENHLSDNGCLYDNPIQVLVMIARVEERTGNTKVWASLKGVAVQATPAYKDLLKQINDALEGGTSLTLQDLTPEAQLVLRCAHPDGDTPIPDLDAE